MSRFEFRFWDKNLCKFIPEKGFLVLPFNDEKYICQQFIGLLDKNDQKIFEGDIVRFVYRWKDITEGNYVVKYYEAMAKFVFDTVIKERESYRDHAVYDIASKLFNSDLEILGNYLENIDLLKS